MTSERVEELMNDFNVESMGLGSGTTGYRLACKRIAELEKAIKLLLLASVDDTCRWKWAKLNPHLNRLALMTGHKAEGTK